ncbi:MAG: hypothetical protein ACREGC_00800, partial [Minisyncoccia bacterium]
MFKAPAIYFPTTIVFLDDDRLYARMLIDHLGIPNLKYFESAHFLLGQKNEDLIFAGNSAKQKGKLDDVTHLRENLEAIKITGDLVSVIVSDLHMAEYSGAAIFSELSSGFVGRILISNFMSYNKNKDIFEGLNAGHINA